jgi:hypothetical protein
MHEICRMTEICSGREINSAVENPVPLVETDTPPHYAFTSSVVRNVFRSSGIVCHAELWRVRQLCKIFPSKKERRWSDEWKGIKVSQIAEETPRSGCDFCTYGSEFLSALTKLRLHQWEYVPSSLSKVPAVAEHRIFPLQSPSCESAKEWHFCVRSDA